MNIEREKKGKQQPKKPQTTEKNCMSNKEKIEYEPKKGRYNSGNLPPIYTHIQNAQNKVSPCPGRLETAVIPLFF